MQPGRRIGPVSRQDFQGTNWHAIEMDRRNCKYEIGTNTTWPMKTTLSFFKLLITAVALLLTSSCATHKPGPANNITGIAKPVVTPGWITFKPEVEINPATLFADYAAIFHLPRGNQMVGQSQEPDELVPRRQVKNGG